jgi:hypothetical protein
MVYKQPTHEQQLHFFAFFSSPLLASECLFKPSPFKALLFTLSLAFPKLLDASKIG